MLKIREEQNEELEKVALKNFEERLLAHVRECWEEEYEEIGEEGARESIQIAFEKSDEYGLESEHEVARYLDLMYTHSFEFDADPQLRWAGAILKHPDLSGTEKLDKLYERTERELDILEQREAEEG